MQFMLKTFIKVDKRVVSRVQLHHCRWCNESAFARKPLEDFAHCTIVFFCETFSKLYPEAGFYRRHVRGLDLSSIICKSIWNCTFPICNLNWKDMEYDWSLRNVLKLIFICIHNCDLEMSWKVQCDRVKMKKSAMYISVRMEI